MKIRATICCFSAALLGALSAVASGQEGGGTLAINQNICGCGLTHVFLPVRLDAVPGNSDQVVGFQFSCRYSPQDLAFVQAIPMPPAEFEGDLRAGGFAVRDGIGNQVGLANVTVFQGNYPPVSLLPDGLNLILEFAVRIDPSDTAEIPVQFVTDGDLAAYPLAILALLTAYEPGSGRFLDLVPSALTDGELTIAGSAVVPAPAAAPSGPTLCGPTGIYLTCGNVPFSCVSFWYTTDGSDPKTSGTRKRYANGAIDIVSDTTFKYYAETCARAGAVKTINYNVITEGDAPHPYARPAGGTFCAATEVVLLCDDCGTDWLLVYSTNTDGPLSQYNGEKIAKTSSGIIRFQAVHKECGGASSPIRTEEYAIDTSDPVPYIWSPQPNQIFIGYGGRADVGISGEVSKPSLVKIYADGSFATETITVEKIISDVTKNVFSSQVSLAHGTHTLKVAAYDFCGHHVANKDKSVTIKVAAPTPTPSPTPSPSPSASKAPTPSPSPTKTPTPSPTATPSPSPSPRRTPTPSPSTTPSAKPSVTPTPSPSPKRTPTPSPTATPSPSPTKAPTPSPTATPSPSPTKTPTPSPTPSPCGGDRPLAPRLLAAYRQGDGVVIDWEDVTEDINGNSISVESYNVYRATRPDWQPSSIDVVASPGESFYIDADAIQRSENYFYYVTAWKGDTESDFSELALKYQHHWDCHAEVSNIHWVSLPYWTAYARASDLGNAIGAGRPCTQISRWSGQTQEYESLTWFTPLSQWKGIDFSIRAGEAYLVVINENTEFAVVGFHDSHQGFSWSPHTDLSNIHWLSLPYHENYSRARELGGAIGAGTVVTQVSRWSDQTQEYETLTWFPPLSNWTGIDFEVLPGSGHLIVINGEIDGWIPAISPPRP